MKKVTNEFKIKIQLNDKLSFKKGFILYIDCIGIKVNTNLENFIEILSRVAITKKIEEFNLSIKKINNKKCFFNEKDSNIYEINDGTNCFYICRKHLFELIRYLENMHRLYTIEFIQPFKIVKLTND